MFLSPSKIRKKESKKPLWVSILSFSHFYEKRPFVCKPSRGIPSFRYLFLRTCVVGRKKLFFCLSWLGTRRDLRQSRMNERGQKKKQDQSLSISSASWRKVVACSKETTRTKTFLTIQWPQTKKFRRFPSSPSVSSNSAFVCLPKALVPPYKVPPFRVHGVLEKANMVAYGTYPFLFTSNPQTKMLFFTPAYSICEFDRTTMGKLLRLFSSLDDRGKLRNFWLPDSALSIPRAPIKDGWTENDNSSPWQRSFPTPLSL